MFKAHNIIVILYYVKLKNNICKKISKKILLVIDNVNNIL